MIAGGEVEGRCPGQTGPLCPHTSLDPFAKLVKLRGTGFPVAPLPYSKSPSDFMSLLISTVPGSWRGRTPGPRGKRGGSPVSCACTSPAPIASAHPCV
uniref:Choline transporter-like protein 2 n=1 Tax=Pan troglodytes TaxID=9598 RepID=G2HH54_PANTR|nr:choline transporter-like protein 2 [Pan troglodytes]